VASKELNMNRFFAVFIFLFCITTHGQLAVTVAPPKVTGQKAVVELTMKNELTNEVKSARAICLLSDEQGKIVGQSTKWVIGQNKTGLASKGQAKFNFVITSPRPLVTSNLTAKVIFSRLILDSGKVADVRQNVDVTSANADGKSQ
jgi:hypothetical protein